MAYASIEDGENSRRRALGLGGIKFEWDVVRTIITRFDASQQTDLAEFEAGFAARPTADRMGQTAWG
jgi:chromosome partitioning protein